MVEIPQKLYFKIGEVANLTRVKPYVLRYWEKEFKVVSPMKSRGNQRVYKRRDIELILYIKNLLYEEGFTLEGAKKKVREFRKEQTRQLNLKFPDKRCQNALKDIRKDLTSIRNILA